jgi:hypothetical protein
MNARRETHRPRARVLLGWVVLLALCPAITTHAQPGRVRPASAVEAGERAIADLRVEEAAELARAALRERPDDPRAIALMGVVAFPPGRLWVRGEPPRARRQRGRAGRAADHGARHPRPPGPVRERTLGGRQVSSMACARAPMPCWCPMRSTRCRRPTGTSAGFWATVSRGRFASRSTPTRAAWRRCPRSRCKTSSARGPSRCASGTG